MKIVLHVTQADYPEEDLHDPGFQSEKRDNIAQLLGLSFQEVEYVIDGKMCETCHKPLVGVYYEDRTNGHAEIHCKDCHKAKVHVA